MIRFRSHRKHQSMTTATAPAKTQPDIPASIMDQGEFRYWTTTDKGVVFRPDVPQDVWESATKDIVDMFEQSHELHARSMFMLGDALRFGEDKFGESYAQAIDATRAVMRLKMKTIENAAWIASKIPAELRRDTLSLTHHEIVAKLSVDEQREFLDRAENEGLSTQELKKAVQERHPKPSKPTEPDEPVEREITEQEALDALETVLAYLTEAEDAEPFKAWAPVRKVRWIPGMTEVAQFAKRFLKK